LQHKAKGEKMKKYWLSLAMVFTVVFILIMDVSGPLRIFSAFENRYLTLKPTPSVDTILSNEFSADFEKYVNDQLVGQDYWITLKATFEKLTNKKENNGIYFGKHGFLFEKIVAAEDQLTKNVQYMNEFLAMYPNLPISLMIPLSSYEVYNDQMPSFAPSFDQKKWYSSFQNTWPLVDPMPLLQTSKDQVYYRNDHHWTLYGAYLEYTKLLKSMGLHR
jgi:hypothetical protein